MKTCLLITAWNRAAQLQRSLDRLTTLTLPDEVLVVDDGSEEDLQGVCTQFEGRLPIRYIYTNNPGLQLCAHARNVGIKNTDAELVLGSEPEMYFVTDVVAQMRSRWVELHEAGRRELISAGIVYHAQHEHMSTPEQANRLEGWVAPYTWLVAREELLAVGGWNEFELPGAWGFDDIDLLTRMRINGVGQYIDHEIEAFHQWHENPGRDNVGAMANDGWWRAQNLDERFKTEPDCIIANKGREWGIVKP